MRAILICAWLIVDDVLRSGWSLARAIYKVKWYVFYLLGGIVIPVTTTCLTFMYHERFLWEIQSCWILWALMPLIMQLANEWAESIGGRMRTLLLPRGYGVGERGSL